MPGYGQRWECPGSRLSGPAVPAGDPASASGLPSGRLSPTASGHGWKRLPGHSGGPLLDASGRVVGVNALKRVRGEQGVHAQGQGIAVPIALALREFPQIRPGAARPVMRR